MADNILWSGDMDIVYGSVQCFKDNKDFISEVSEEYKHLTGKSCTVKVRGIKSCISTLEGIAPETITPLDSTDITISNFYIADVEEIE